MKINWGTGIVITLIIFVGSMAFLIWISYQQRINLVTEDYYAKGINYESRIKQIKNADSLTIPLTVKAEGNNIVVQFPNADKTKLPTGKIIAFRPSDNRLDKVYKINPDSAFVQKIPLSDFIQGMYIFQVEWQQNRTDFYSETKLNL